MRLLVPVPLAIRLHVPQWYNLDTAAVWKLHPCLNCDATQLHGLANSIQSYKLQSSQWLWGKKTHSRSRQLLHRSLWTCLACGWWCPALSAGIKARCCTTNGQLKPWRLFQAPAVIVLPAAQINQQPIEWRLSSPDARRASAEAQPV